MMKKEYSEAIFKNGFNVVPVDLESIAKKYGDGKKILDRWKGVVKRRVVISKKLKDMACICGEIHKVKNISGKKVIFCKFLDIRVSEISKLKVLNKWVMTQVSIIDKVEDFLNAKKNIDKNID